MVTSDTIFCWREEGDRPPSEVGRWRRNSKIGYKIFNNFFREPQVLSADKKVHQEHLYGAK